MPCRTADQKQDVLHPTVMQEGGHQSLDAEANEAYETLAQVIVLLEETLQRPSRWAGSVELTDSLFTSGIAHLDGRIEITRAVWRQPQYRWRTVIHEALHLFSPCYTKHAYSIARGWEEGVVEQMQRLLRQDVLQRLGAAIPEEAFAERDSRHEYNRYLQALERLRQPLKATSLEFYRWLLATPLPERLEALETKGNTLPEQERSAFRRTLLFAQGILGRM